MKCKMKDAKINHQQIKKENQEWCAQDLST